MSNSQDPLSRDREETPATTPANTLRRLRREADLSVEAVCEATKISVTNVRAIEGENYERLPADTFVRGLVTLYGNFLGIDGPKIAAEFLAEREKNDPTAGRQARMKKPIYSSSLSPRKLAEPSHISSATIALILLVVIILSFTGFSLYTSWNPFAFLSQQGENMQTSMQGIFNSGTPQETGVEATDEQRSYTLSAHFLQDSEVMVKIDDLDPIRQTFTDGEIAHWSARDSLQVTFDKPEAATLTLNDSPLAFPEPNGNQLPTLQLPSDLLDQ
ncbi:MAG: helix-turn-helix domain-containing protein [Desulfobulbaceae bacterium]|nr:helix-turn-helix domain-containing protein [Desulfobulbaceae bacterium]